MNDEEIYNKVINNIGIVYYHNEANEELAKLQIFEAIKLARKDEKRKLLLK